MKCCLFTVFAFTNMFAAALYTIIFSSSKQKKQFLYFILASDGEELAKIQKVKVLRNEKRQGELFDFTNLKLPTIPPVFV